MLSSIYVSNSPTYGSWHSFEPNFFNGRALIPERCAHGFQVLEDGSESFIYTQSGSESETGVR